MRRVIAVPIAVVLLGILSCKYVHVIGDDTDSGTPPLNKADFNGLLGKYHVLAEFYAPWCGHCKRLAPTWERLTKIFNEDLSVKIVRIDATKEDTLATKYGIKGFPSILYFKKEHEDSDAPEVYTSGRDIDSFVEFINEKASTMYTSDGSIKSRIPDIEKLLDAVSCKDLTYGDCLAALINSATSYVTNLQSTAKDEMVTKYAKFYERALSKAKDNASWVAHELSRLSNILKTSVESISNDHLQYLKGRVGVLEYLKEKIAKLTNTLQEEL